MSFLSTDEDFRKMNDAVLEFVVKHRDSDPLVATMQRTITELSAHYADITLDLSKRLMSVDLADKVLRALLSYIEQEYPEEYKAFPPVSGFTCV